jgi:hypothetical protein
MTQKQNDNQYWNSLNSPRAKNVCKSRSKFEDMLNVFFNVQGVVMTEWDSRGQNVNHIIIGLKS